MRFLAIILLALSFQAHSFEVERDKLMHFGVSAALGATSTYIVRDTERPIIYGTALALLPGLAKELRDSHEVGNSFSGRDMGANLAGALLGATISNSVRLYFSKGSLAVSVKFN